jgi:hypothetical protein
MKKCREILQACKEIDQEVNIGGKNQTWTWHDTTIGKKIVI